MTKSGLADSPFFSRSSNLSIPVPSPVIEEPSTEKAKEKSKSSSEASKSQVTEKPRHQDTVVSSNRDTMPLRNHDTMLETVRKAVKELGKEAATHRFTPDEKRAVLDIVYSYKSSGIRTSENEVARIAIDYILEDYKQHGKNSILDRVLQALNE